MPYSLTLPLFHSFTLLSAPLRLCGSLLLLAGTLHSAEPRYEAVFANGDRVTDEEVREWFEPTSQPKITGRNLFDTNNPARWVMDRQTPPAATPDAYVEFFVGDRLAGDVTRFQNGSDSPFEQLPPHLVIETEEAVHAPEDQLALPVRVATEWLQRVVWERTGSDEYRPGTVFLRNGGAIPFRTLRWAEQAVSLLTTEGVREFGFDDIAEIHLPRTDSWEAYFDQLALLSPRAESRLIQLEATDGSRLTTSQQRFQAQHRQDRNRPDSWLQVLQPVWSLDPLWVRYRTIRVWRFFAPTDVPLTLILPAAVQQHSTFGSGWRWQSDRNVQGGPLQSGGQNFGWGFGVQAAHEMQFDLPGIARSFRTKLGLDQSVGRGGCVRASVSLGPESSQPLYQSKLLIGSGEVLDTDRLPLAESTEKRRLVLSVDDAHADRPPGADPFDIRDMLDWLEPELQLDSDGLKAELSRRVINRLPALAGWTLSDTDRAALQVQSLWDTTDPRDPRYRTTLRTTERFVTFSRRLRIPSDHRWLALVVSRFPNETTPTRVQVRIDGKALAEAVVPERQGPSDPDPIGVPLGSLQGQTVDLEVVLVPDGDKSWFDWRGLTTLRHRPGLVPLFEDDAEFAAALQHERGTVTVTTATHYAGKAALELRAPRAEAAQLPGLHALIREHTKLGDFRYVRFAWKKPEGRHLGLQFAHEGRFIDDNAGNLPPLRTRRRRDLAERGFQQGFTYLAGRGKPEGVRGLLLQGDLPKEWLVQTRDLFGDFGDFTLTGFALLSLDGQPAWFDHLYLARTPRDLDVLSDLTNPPKPDSNILRHARRPPEFGEVLSHVAPQFSTAASQDGVALLKQHAGQSEVVRTHPPAPGQPCVLRATVELPPDKPMTLELLVSHLPQRDWQLMVKANGEQLHTSLISDSTTKEKNGWAAVSVDLTRFAGQKILLEAQNHPNDWNGEYAFWKRGELVEQ